MTTTMNPGIHPSQTLRVIRLLWDSREAYDRGNRDLADALLTLARKTSGDAFVGITGGMQLGEIPEPGTPAGEDWYAIQCGHLQALVDDDPERVHICEGGPLDGKVYAEPKALVPPQNMLPTPDAGRRLFWPDEEDASVSRYMPELDWVGDGVHRFTQLVTYEPIRMVWTTPDQARQVFPRPEAGRD